MFLVFPTLFLLLLFVVCHTGQELYGVLSPDPHCSVELQLQDVVVVHPGGLYHLLHVSDELFPLNKLDTGVDLGMIDPKTIGFSLFVYTE